jgi:Thioredoxin
MVTSRIWFTAAQKAELWERWKNGQSAAAISRALERRNKTGVERIVVLHGGIVPAPRRRVGYAKMLGLDVQRFVKDVNAGTLAAKIKHDFQTGVMSGVNGTPSLFINGKRYDGGYDAEPLLKVLQAVATESGPPRKPPADKGFPSAVGAIR